MIQKFKVEFDFTTEDDEELSAPKIREMLTKRLMEGIPPTLSNIQCKKVLQ